MRTTVGNLTSDTDIDGATDERKSTRQQMQELGDLLVNSTDEVLRCLKTFIPTFNKSMQHICIRTLNFDGADYRVICTKEVDEIRNIFNEFSI